MDELTRMWMGSNLSQEGLNQVVNGTQRKSRTKKTEKQEAVDSRSEFLRLARAMRG